MKDTTKLNISAVVIVIVIVALTILLNGCGTPKSTSSPDVGYFKHNKSLTANHHKKVKIKDDQCNNYAQDRR